MKTRNLILSFAVLLLLINCQGTSGDTHMKSLNGKWEKDQNQAFKINVDSPKEAKNIYILVRNNNQYPYSNIRFFIELTNLKTKKSSIDTLNYILAKPNGEWLGSGFGNTKEIVFQYKMNYSFPNSGQYKVGIKHAMRKDTLTGIEDIGIKIEKTTL